MSENTKSEKTVEIPLADVLRVYEWLRGPDWGDDDWDIVGWLNSRPIPQSMASVFHAEEERAAVIRGLARVRASSEASR